MVLCVIRLQGAGAKKPEHFAPAQQHVYANGAQAARLISGRLLSEWLHGLFVQLSNLLLCEDHRVVGHAGG